MSNRNEIAMNRNKKVVEKTWITRAGYDAVCLFIRGTHRCGYVGIPPKHPLHRVDYCKPTDVLKDGAKPETALKVHGGLTYAAGSKDYPIKCSDNLWWYGFDCAHAGDGMLGIMVRLTLGKPVRSMDYVIDECEKLADQLKEIQNA